MAFGRWPRVVGSRLDAASVVLGQGSLVRAHKPHAALRSLQAGSAPLGRRCLRRWPGIHREASYDCVIEKEGCKSELVSYRPASSAASTFALQRAAVGHRAPILRLG